MSATSARVPGWVLLINEDSEQARVLVALLVSITFLSLHLTIKPIRRAEDEALMTLVELALILIYTCALLIKACDTSAAICRTFGFGDTGRGDDCPQAACHLQCTSPAAVVASPELAFYTHLRAHEVPFDSAGVYLFFIFMGLGMLVLQLLIGITNMFITGHVPTLLLVAQAHSMSPSTVIKR